MRIEDGIATISIRRPEVLNALSKDLIDEMDIMLDEIKANPEVRVLVFYSEKNFAAGADIKEMSVCDPAGAKAFVFSSTYNKIEALGIPSIAVIDGYAFGGGLELALTCDLRIASKKATLGLTELNLGIIPGAGGTVRLPRLVGEAKAKEMIFMSRTVSGEEAKQIGLVNAAVEPEELLETGAKWAEKLKTRSAVALRAAKESIENGIRDTDYVTAIDREAEIWASLFDSYDQKEGMAAFIEKRKPKFQNR
nr:enoyl-CoA hydratase-related protein [uncultured Oscillibacter sp.]